MLFCVVCLSPGPASLSSARTIVASHEFSPFVSVFHHCHRSFVLCVCLRTDNCVKCFEYWYIFFVLSFDGEYQRRWLPVKNHIWNDLLCVESDVKLYSVVSRVLCGLKEEVRRPRISKLVHRIDATSPHTTTQITVPLVLSHSKSHHGSGGLPAHMTHSVSSPVLQGAWGLRSLEHAVPPLPAARHTGTSEPVTILLPWLKSI